MDLNLFFVINVKIAKIKTAIAKATTPPNLLGIQRKIAYAYKKYHSGWIWTGVTIGFASEKFSGSPKTQGSIKVKKVKEISKIKNPKMSLKEKNIWNEIFSKFELRPNREEDPFSWRNKRWIIINPKTTKGNIKWKEKNRVNVGFITA